jgi:hypothetical protein
LLKRARNRIWRPECVACLARGGGSAVRWYRGWSWFASGAHAVGLIQNVDGLIPAGRHCGGLAVHKELQSLLSPREDLGAPEPDELRPGGERRAVVEILVLDCC